MQPMLFKRITIAIGIIPTDGAVPTTRTDGAVAITGTGIIGMAAGATTEGNLRAGIFDT